MGKWTRRGFIASGVAAGGVLVVGVALRPGNRNAELAGLVANDDEVLVNSWVKIAPDNTVTAIVPHSEMGQGAQSALAQMLGDELGATWDQLRVLEAPDAPEYANFALGKGYLMGGASVPEVLVPTLDGAFMQIAKLMDLQITGGSLSVRTTGVYGMRVAGAAAREMLSAVAAADWGVPLSELMLAEGMVRHGPSGREAPFSEFAERAGALTPPSTPQLKDPSQFTLMGQPLPRKDLPEKVDGSARFGIDADVPGMKYAAIKGSPVFGGTVAEVNDAAARAMPGVIDVVRLDDAVAVVADGYWLAEQALKQVEVRFADEHANAVDQDSIFEQFAASLDNGEGREDLVSGDAAGALAAAASTVEAEYRVPYLAHSCMEPLNATARVTDEGCEVWTGTQNPLGFRTAVAAELGLDIERVRIHNHYMGGGFGRRATPDYAIQAAKLSAAVGQPVKLIWSREEDTRQDRYRPAVLSRFKAAFDAEGNPIAWQNHFVDKHEPAEATHIPYAISNLDVRDFESPTHVPFGAWRSVDHSQHSFFTESFADELAHARGEDPYEFRRRLLSHNPRLRAVLDKAAEASDWERELPPGWGRGIALQESFGTLVSQVLEVEVVDGKVRVDRVVCAVDPGFAVNPDGLTAQMESGIVYGLTAALYGEISIEGGAVKQSNFHDYEMLRMHEMPRVETHIINSGAAWGGAGEPGTPTVAPALANAIFDATGTRIRQLPVKIYDLEFRIEETDKAV